MVPEERHGKLGGFSFLLEVAVNKPGSSKLSEPERVLTADDLISC